MTSAHRAALGLALLAAVLYGIAASARDFWSPDEPDFAEHVREMFERRDFLIPYENGRPYSEKPILFYWAMAAASAVAGGDVHPLATRLPSVVAAAFLVFGAAALAGFRGGRREALVAGTATAVAPIVFWQGQFLQTDALFSALVFASLCSVILVQEDPGNAAKWRWGLHLTLPLAVLTKGPLAVAIVSLLVACQVARERTLAPISRLRPIRGALLFVLVVFPWYVLATRAGGPAYAYDLVVNQNWNRFFNAFDHVQPWWFYLESMWGDFFPFTLPALLAPFVLRATGQLERRGELRLAAVTCAAVMVFLSLSGAKQGKYALVVYPFAAVLVAAAARTADETRAAVRTFRVYQLLVAAVLVAAGIAVVGVVRTLVPQLQSLAPVLSGTLVLGGLAAFVAAKKGVAAGFLAAAGAVAAAEIATALAVFPAIDTLKTGRPFYERIRPLVSHGEPLAYYGGTYHCYPILVLRRRTDFVRSELELIRWLDQTPGGMVLVDESERMRWKSPALRSLQEIDSQPTGQDRIVLLDSHG